MYFLTATQIKERQEAIHRSAEALETALKVYCPAGHDRQNARGLLAQVERIAVESIQPNALFGR
jgi:hypothetical protein